MHFFPWLFPFLLVTQVGGSRIAVRSIGRAADAISNIAVRELQSGSTVEEFCSDLTNLEAFALQFSFNPSDLPTVISDGYECSCTAQDPLVLDCFVTYKFPDEAETFTRNEKVEFALEDGQYVPATATFCSKEVGADSEEVCDIYQYCEDNPERLCTCTSSDGCLCEICPDGQSVSLDCSAVSNETISCDDGYSGPALSQYNFPTILASESTSAARQMTEKWLFVVEGTVLAFMILYE